MIDAAMIQPLPADDLFDGDPIPLIPRNPLPPFPTDQLPAAVRNMVEAISVATQTDPAMAGTSALTSLSACTGGRAAIEVRPGWCEPLNIFGAAVAAPGERKSAVQSAMSRPVLVAERELIDHSHAERVEAMARKEVAERAAEAAKAAAVKASDPDAALADALGAVELADQITVPPIPRIIADDVTPEAAASLMAEQGGALAIISAEGGIFDIIGGRYSGNVPNLDVFLKGHSGDPVKVDRKGRPPEYIERPALTLGLMIQPDVLASIGAHRQFRGRGLLARILFALPVSKVGHRTVGAPPADSAVVEAYERTVSALAMGMFARRSDPVMLTLSDAARQGVLEIERSVEESLREYGDLRPVAEWGSKYVGAVARIAGILHMAQHGAGRGPREKVSAETVLAAHRVGSYYRACALRAFALMGTDSGTADAIYLLGRIVSLGADQASERDIFNAARSRFKTKPDMALPLERLVDHGFLALIPVERPVTRGRPASPRFAIHPMAAEIAESAQT